MWFFWGTFMHIVLHAYFLRKSWNTSWPLQDKGPSEPTTSINPRQEPDPSQFYDSANDQHSTNAPPPANYHDNLNDQHSTNIPPSFQYQDKANDHHSTSAPPHHFHDEASNHQHSTNLPTVPRSYSTASYTSQDFPPPPGNRPETSDYSQSFQHHQSYGQEPQQHLPHNFPPDSSSYSYLHFQSYPSFSDSSLPAVSPHYSYYQGSDASFTPAPQSAPPTTSHQPTAQFQPSISRNGSISEAPAPPAPVKTYEYDSNYQPPPEKIAEAQKAARFAVGALAFDDVSVAVDYLRKSLELLTNPSAKAGQWAHSCSVRNSRSSFFLNRLIDL